MPLKNPKTKNNLPILLQSLTPKEIFLYSGIPLNRLKVIATGEFKSNENDRQKLTSASMLFYGMNAFEIQGFVQRKKYRIIRSVISMTEKNELLSDGEKYLERLDALIDRHWDQIVKKITEEKS